MIDDQDDDSELADSSCYCAIFQERLVPGAMFGAMLAGLGC